MKKKYFAAFFAGMAVMGIVMTGIQNMNGNTGRLSDRYDYIEAKLDVIDRTISDYYLNEDEIKVYK